MNDSLKQFVLRLLQGDRPAGSQALENTLDSTWPWPAWLFWTILIGGIAFVVTIYIRERESAGRLGKTVLASIRVLMLMVLAWMLLGWTWQQHRTDLPDLVVVIDDSGSMALADELEDASLRANLAARLKALKFDELTRLNIAKTLLLESNEKLLKELESRYRLKVVRMSEPGRTLETKATSLVQNVNAIEAKLPASRLGDSLREVIETQRGRPTAAIVMLTDGITTEGSSLQDAAAYARRKSIPLYFIGIGNERPPIDLQLADLLADEAVFLGDAINFEFRLSSRGYSGNAKVSLFRDGQSEPLAEQTLKVTGDEASQVVRLRTRPAEQGDFDYVVQVEPQPREMNTTNNKLSRRVAVREEKLRVLYAQSYPNYEFRYLKNVLERELNRPGQEGEERGFRSVLQEADVEFAETDKSAKAVFPVSREELFKYDVLILGDVNPALLTNSVLENIYEFVNVRGGGLIMMAGPKYLPLAYRDSPLAALFPANVDSFTVPDSDTIIKNGFRPRLTPLGQNSPALQLTDSPADTLKLWNETLPQLRWFARINDLRPGVRVLAEHPELRGLDNQPLPIITLQFHGAGKVVFHATDETYRWRFRAGDMYFARYWIQTIRYLSRSKLLGEADGVELTADRDEYQQGEAIRLRARFLDERAAPTEDDGVLCIVQHEAGQRRSVRLRRDALNRGLFEAVIDTLPPGRYRAWIAAPVFPGRPPSREFRVQSPPGELAEVQMKAADLQAAAKASEGQFYRVNDAGKLLAALPPGRHVRVESLPPEPLWNLPWLPIVFVSLLASEWLLRKKLGLV
ncbi:VWA domain-containing protein [Anatilimnocola floriformis]|uniref:VWA domain-containing protein n=1 Tax=Anatilimnocola floriformis TaxID=2948575 RepID=UPI0020C3FE50|nr:VWA domain-containing protein [Anatilimnocola floriformis]